MLPPFLGVLEYAMEKRKTRRFFVISFAVYHLYNGGRQAAALRLNRKFVAEHLSPRFVNCLTEANYALSFKGVAPTKILSTASIIYCYFLLLFTLKKPIDNTEQMFYNVKKI